jgi:hypothetical protein
MEAKLARLRATVGAINDMARATDPDASGPLEHAVGRELLGMYAEIASLRERVAFMDRQELRTQDAIRAAKRRKRALQEGRAAEAVLAETELWKALDALEEPARG